MERCVTGYPPPNPACTHYRARPPRRPRSRFRMRRSASVILPGRPPETTLILDILRAVRSADVVPHADPAKLPGAPAIDEIFDVLDRATGAALEGRTLKDLAVAEEPGVSPVARAGGLR